MNWLLRLEKGKYVLAEYENIKRITMPLGNGHLIYITTDIEADHSRILEGIKDIATPKTKLLIIAQLSNVVIIITSQCKLCGPFTVCFLDLSPSPPRIWINTLAILNFKVLWLSHMQ